MKIDAKQKALDELERVEQERDEQFAESSNELAKESRQFFLQIGMFGVLILTVLLPTISQKLELNRVMFSVSIIAVFFATIFSFLYVKYSLDSISKRLHLVFMAYDEILRIARALSSSSTEEHHCSLLSEAKKHWAIVDNNSEEVKKQKKYFAKEGIWTFQNLICLMLFGGLAVFLIDVLRILLSSNTIVLIPSVVEMSIL